MLPLAGCSDSEDDQGTTEGPAYIEPAALLLSPYDEEAAAHFSTASATASIDASSVEDGYVAACASAPTRCKLQVVCGDMSYNYDLPSDGSPISAPLNMGDGAYTFRIMQNTSGNSYVEIARMGQQIQMTTLFEPFLRPNVFCQYSPESDCVVRAALLAAGSANEGDVVRAVYDWMTAHIRYDDAKADELADATGYVPDPDATLSSGKGICFDYASLAAAMFRSLGLPCQIVTGYVSPEDIYHAWNMIYIDGEWVSAHITVTPDEWCRVDLTFAAAAEQSGGNMANVGDGTHYTDRYIY